MSAVSDFKKNAKKKMSIKLQKKKVFRENEPLVAIFMWGINYTHNELKQITMPELLMPDEFKAYIKVKIDNQNFNKAILPSHYKVKEYCPLVFKNIRERFNISEESYLRSLTYDGMESLDDTNSKSNAKFYRSHDRRYVIKTVTSEDVEGLHNILPDYHKHIVETKGNTLLPHLLSLFRLTVENKENYVLVMRSVFSNKFKVHLKYDIKGSTVDREATLKEKEKSHPTYKDNDLVNDARQINIGSESKRIFMEKLTRDVGFLCSLKIMDYSLLIGIHDEKLSLTKANLSDSQSDDQGASSSSPSNNYILSEKKFRALSTSDTEQTATVGDDKTDSEQDDNFSPGEDAEETDDGQNVSCSTPPGSPFTNQSRVGIFGIPSASDAKKEIYFMALIDILTQYGLKKRSANVAKTVKYGDQEISTVKPEQYSKRFLDFINKIVV